MFQQDPKKRPSAEEILNHKFFNIQIHDETEIPNEKLSAKSKSESTRLASKSTEKTYGSYSTISTAHNHDKFQQQNAAITSASNLHKSLQEGSLNSYRGVGGGGDAEVDDFDLNNDDASHVSNRAVKNLNNKSYNNNNSSYIQKHHDF